MSSLFSFGAKIKAYAFSKDTFLLYMIFISIPAVISMTALSLIPSPGLLIMHFR